MQSIMADKYYFKVEVQAGPPGFCDDETYWSESFTSLRHAYTALDDFVPQREWYYFRRVEHMYIWREGYPEVHVGKIGLEIKDEDLPKLGVTREEFYKLVQEIWGTTIAGEEDEDKID